MNRPKTESARQLFLVALLLIGSYFVAGWLSEEFISLLLDFKTPFTEMISARPDLFVRGFKFLFFAMALWIYLDELKKLRKILFPA